MTSFGILRWPNHLAVILAAFVVPLALGLAWQWRSRAKADQE